MAKFSSFSLCLGSIRVTIAFLFRRMACISNELSNEKKNNRKI